MGKRKIDYENLTDEQIEREVGSYIEGIGGLSGLDLANELRDRLEGDARYWLAAGYSAGLMALKPGLEKREMVELNERRHLAYTRAAEAIQEAMDALKRFKK